MKRKVSQLSIARKYLQLVESAAKRDIPINLSLTDVKRLLSCTHCEISGVELVDSNDIVSTSRTIDRHDSTKGYVRGNVFAVCHAYNAMKNTYFEQAKPTGALANTSTEDIKKVFKALSEL